MKTNKHPKTEFLSPKKAQIRNCLLQDGSPDSWIRLNDTHIPGFVNITDALVALDVGSQIMGVSILLLVLVGLLLVAVPIYLLLTILILSRMRSRQPF